MKAIAIIPARMGSSRFPGKPMAKILGIPMIGHCFFRTRMCAEVAETYVATCDREIYDYIKSIKGKVVMTKDTHERASDRAAEAMLKIESEMGCRTDIAVMVQGDEPMLTPSMITQALLPMRRDPAIQVVNLMARIKTIEEFEDPNTVKVVVDSRSQALYFSREPIPSRKKGGKDIPMLKQVCIIPFRRDYLLKFNKLSTTPLEIIESVDMMRIIEHGDQVKMVLTEESTFSVDTMSDLTKVENMMEKDLLIQQYSHPG